MLYVPVVALLAVAMLAVGIIAERGGGTAQAQPTVLYDDRNIPDDPTPGALLLFPGPYSIQVFMRNLDRPNSEITGYHVYWAWDESGHDYSNANRVFSPHVYVSPVGDAYSSVGLTIRNLTADKRHKVKIVPTGPSYVEIPGLGVEGRATPTGESTLQSHYAELIKIEKARCAARNDTTATNCVPPPGTISVKYHYAASIRYARDGGTCRATTRDENDNSVPVRWQTPNGTSPEGEYIAGTVTLVGGEPVVYNGPCSSAPAVATGNAVGNSDGQSNNFVVDRRIAFTQSILPAVNIQMVENCFTELSPATHEHQLSGEWLWDVDIRQYLEGSFSYSLSDVCRAHHMGERPARYLQFTLDEATTVAFDLKAQEASSSAALYVSNDEPKNPWGTPPRNGYQNRIDARKANGKLVHAGAAKGELELQAGSYTVEAVAKSDNADTFTLNIKFGDAAAEEDAVTYSTLVAPPENDPPVDDVPETVVPEKTPPTASAGAHFNGKRGETLELAGSGTPHAHGSQTLTYQWAVKRASDPELATVAATFLTNADKATASFTVPRRKHMKQNRSALDDSNWVEFQLTVTDGDKESATATVVMTIQGTTWK